jgi:hypothetical protein
MCEKLCFQEISELDIEGISSLLGKSFGFFDVFLRLLWMRCVQEKGRERLVNLSYLRGVFQRACQLHCAVIAFPSSGQVS